jgi:hypothetical protein
MTKNRVELKGASESIRKPYGKLIDAKSAGYGR